MMYRLSSLSASGRVIFLGIFVAALTSCFATTDKLAVYEETVLSKKQIDALAGHYGLVSEQGNVSSLIFTPRTDRWSYQPAARTLELASADFTMKSLTIFDDGGSAIFILMGVAVFSKIPDTDLILVSIPGETIRTNDEDGSMRPASKQNASTNLFFVLKQDGSKLTKQIYSEKDEGLKVAVGDPSKPLPVDKLLSYLEEHAQERFMADEPPTYHLSTPRQKKLIEQEMNAALSEDREERARGAAPGQQPPAEPDRTTGVQTDNNDPSAMLREFGKEPLANEYRRGLVHQWAEDGLLEAQALLGAGYSLGEKLPKDSKKALHWYRLAAKQGHAHAQSMLAHLYMGYDDESVRNVPKSLHWTRKAAEQGKAPNEYALWNINAALKPGIRYLADPDDLAWLNAQLSGGDHSDGSQDADNSQCRAEAARHVTECAKVTDYSSCTSLGCSDAIICDSKKGGCDDHDSPYGRRGIFYCDTRNWRNRDQNRDAVLAHACPVDK